MKTLVIGASGLVGHSLMREFALLGEVRGTCHSQKRDGLVPLDITQPSQIRALLQSYRPNTIVLPASFTNVEGCEENETLSRQTNLDGPCRVAELAEQLHARLVFFSTDYVFDGNAGPYAEEDTPAPLNVYGRHKLAAEDCIRKTVDRHLILRTSGVYGWELAQKNFVLQLLRRLRAGERAKVFSDQYGTPTYGPDLARATRELVVAGAAGLVHAAGAGFINRVELGQAVAETFQLDVSLLNPIRTAELRQKARRPLRAGLRIKKINDSLSYPMLSLRAGLAHMKATESGTASFGISEKN